MDSPDCLSRPYQAAAACLPDLRGADSAYSQYIVQAHEEAVDDFAAEAKEGHNPQLKAYTAEILPALQEHLQLTCDLSAKCQ